MEYKLYSLRLEDIQDEKILYQYIYNNKERNYYISEEFSKELYVELAFCGFISTSITFENKIYLLPEMQFDYALLDFNNLHISKKVQKILNKNQYQFSINQRVDEVLDSLNRYHTDNWLKDEYKELIKNLQGYKHPKIDFEIMSIELRDKATNEIIAGEIGYKIGSTYTSLTGFSSKEKKYRDYGKLQLVLLAKYLEKNGYSFWNLGHATMKYKFDLGAKKLNRYEFLRRWIKAREITLH